MIDIWPVTIPQLTGEEERKVYVYVPNAYRRHPEERYPVLYMFDGHNLFYDEEASYGKSWGLKEYLDKTRKPLIVVGVECNHHSEEEECGGRLSEYSPFDFDDPNWGFIKGRGKITMDWFVKELKPYIDDNYPTLRDRRHTFIAGSSMGGLMTIYALTKYNRYFSRGAALSPALLFGYEEYYRLIENSLIRKGTVMYMDYGEKELRYDHLKGIYSHACGLLVKKGVLLESRIVPGGFHSEASWERQIPFFMDVLFYELNKEEE